uniref:Uncharacterized protein n=1 Tax=Globodera rostochiensis TaxID=31243 RepID=A0A914I4H2_GLORO
MAETTPFLISYIDHTVLAFLQRVQRLFNVNIFLDLAIPASHQCWEVFLRHIWPLLNARSISEIALQEGGLDNLHFISPTVLRDCANLQAIRCHQHFPEAPADDGTHTPGTSNQALFKWLHSPLLHCSDDVRMPNRKAALDVMVKTFVNASSPAGYVVELRASGEKCIKERIKMLANGTTDEMMAFHATDSWTRMLKRLPFERDKWRRSGMLRIPYYGHEIVDWPNSERPNHFILAFYDD